MAARTVHLDFRIEEAADGFVCVGEVAMCNEGVFVGPVSGLGRGL